MRQRMVIKKMCINFSDIKLYYEANLLLHNIHVGVNPNKLLSGRYYCDRHSN